MKTLHPLPCFVCFFSIIIITATVQNPLFTIISLLFSITSAILSKGKKAVSAILCILPFCVLAVIINALFVNRGAAVLFYLANGNAVTAEAVIYGGMSAMLIMSLGVWFITFSDIMTSDKVIYLFGKLLPSLGLLVSMTLKAIPDFSRRVRQTAAAQRFVGNDIYSGSIKSRVKSGIAVLSASITGAIEGSAETAMSMKNRGYGTVRRTAYSRYRFRTADVAVLCTTVILIGAVTVLSVTGNADMSFYPYIKIQTDLPALADYSLMLLLCALPPVLTAKERISEQRLINTERGG